MTAEIHVHRSAIQDEAGAAGDFGRSRVVRAVLARLQADNDAPLAVSSVIRFQRGTGALNHGALKHFLSGEDDVVFFERCGNLVVLSVVGM